MESHLEAIFNHAGLVDRSLGLAGLLINETYPREVVDGLWAIANALIETQGFEPVFRECVERARDHVRASNAGYNLPAKVAA